MSSSSGSTNKRHLVITVVLTQHYRWSEPLPPDLQKQMTPTTMTGMITNSVKAATETPTAIPMMRMLCGTSM